tara:strand:- start:118 stop:669 length:552 start_codon:yes stop_codon:yes gene_type:complete
MSKFDAAYTGKLYGLGETVDHDEAIEYDLRSHLEGYLKWRPIDEEDTPERYFDAFVSMLGRVKPELAAAADRSEVLWGVIEDKIAEKGVRNKMDEAHEETGRIPFGKGLDDDLGAEQEAEELRGPLPDEDSIQLSVGDFEKELTDLYWSVVETGVNENDARDWFDNVRKGLHELLTPQDKHLG